MKMPPGTARNDEGVGRVVLMTAWFSVFYPSDYSTVA